MSEDMNKKIKQLTDILGQDTLPDNVKGLLSLLAGAADGENSADSKEAPPIKEEKSNATRSDMEESIEMARKVKRVMDVMKNNNDPRINLLNAVRPFLSSRRQKRLNDCIKLLHMSSLTKLMDEHEKGIL